MTDIVTSSSSNANGRDMSRSGELKQFYDHLQKQHLLAGSGSERFNVSEAQRLGKPLHKLWQQTEISATEYADEVARFFALPRVGLAELMSVAPHTAKFSPRFLRE